MTYEDAIVELSRTRYDVAYHMNKIVIQESTPVGWINIDEELFNGTWENAIIRGAEMVKQLQTKPKRKRKNK